MKKLFLFAQNRLAFQNSGEKPKNNELNIDLDFARKSTQEAAEGEGDKDALSKLEDYVKGDRRIEDEHDLALLIQEAHTYLVKTAPEADFREWVQRFNTLKIDALSKFESADKEVQTVVEEGLDNLRADANDEDTGAVAPGVAGGATETEPGIPDGGEDEAHDGAKEGDDGTDKRPEDAGLLSPELSGNATETKPAQKEKINRAPSVSLSLGRDGEYEVRRTRPAPTADAAYSRTFEERVDLAEDLAEKTDMDLLRISRSQGIPTKKLFDARAQALSNMSDQDLHALAESIAAKRGRTPEKTYKDLISARRGMRVSGKDVLLANARKTPRKKPTENPPFTDPLMITILDPQFGIDTFLKGLDKKGLRFGPLNYVGIAAFMRGEVPFAIKSPKDGLWYTHGSEDIPQGKTAYAVLESLPAGTEFVVDLETMRKIKSDTDPHEAALAYAVNKAASVKAYNEIAQHFERGQKGPVIAEGFNIEYEVGNGKVDRGKLFANPLEELQEAGYDFLSPAVAYVKSLLKELGIANKGLVVESDPLAKEIIVRDLAGGFVNKDMPFATIKKLPEVDKWQVGSKTVESGELEDAIMKFMTWQRDRLAKMGRTGAEGYIAAASKKQHEDTEKASAATPKPKGLDHEYRADDLGKYGQDDEEDEDYADEEPTLSESGR